MGIATATLEMQNPEQTRERLHEMVKATRTVIVLSGAAGAAAGTGIDGRPMALVKAADDTTMFLATSLEPAQAEELERNPRVTVVLQGAGYALFTGEARVSRDRVLIDELWTDSWQRWSRGKADPTLAVVVVSPNEGSYWEGAARESYVYRLID